LKRDYAGFLSALTGTQAMEVGTDVPDITVSTLEKDELLLDINVIFGAARDGTDAVYVLCLQRNP
jgi:glycosyltransferase A (GT-A) superfamily protein (DUF2064 family)